MTGKTTALKKNNYSINRIALFKVIYIQFIVIKLLIDFINLYSCLSSLPYDYISHLLLIIIFFIDVDLVHE